MLLVISCKREQHRTKYRAALTTETKTIQLYCTLLHHRSLGIVERSYLVYLSFLAKVNVTQTQLQVATSFLSSLKCSFII